MHSNSREQHSWQFRDQIIPARVCHLLRQKKITSKDLLLFFVIDALVKAQTDKAGKGCFASNAFLGHAIDAHEKYVAQRIRYLRDKKLLLVIKFGAKKRFLETAWSRTVEEILALEGKYGIRYRKAYLRMFPGEKGVISDGEMSKEKVTNTPMSKENLTNMSKENLTHVSKENLTIYNNDKIDSDRCRCSQNSDGANGLKSLLSDNSNKQVKTSFGQKMAKLLYEGLKQSGKVFGNVNYRSWNKHFDNLVGLLSEREPNLTPKQIKEHIRHVLQDHISNLRMKFQPKCWCARTFCERFIELEDALDRRIKDKEKTESNGDIQVSDRDGYDPRKYIPEDSWPDWLKEKDKLERRNGKH